MMRASIEKLTRLVPMTELFTDGGVRQRQDTDNITRARFNEVLSETQMEEKPEKPEMPGTTRRKEKPEMAGKTEEEKDKAEAEGEENSVAGIFGQNSVVFILEGEEEEESQLRIEDAAVTITTEGDATEDVAQFGQSGQFQVESETAEEAPETQAADTIPDVKTEPNVKAESNEKAETEVKAGANEKAETEVKAKTSEKAEAEVKVETDDKTAADVKTEKADTDKRPETNIKDVKPEQNTMPANTVEAKETDEPETIPVADEKSETKTAAKPEIEQVTEAKPESKTGEPEKTEKTDAEPTEQPEDTQPKTQTVTAGDVKAAEKNAAKETTDTVAAVQPKEDTSQREIQDVPKESEAAEAVVKPADTGETVKAEADDGEEANIDATGKTMARTPETKTAEQSGGEKQEQDKSFSENGKLCPLENENDETPVEGKKTYKTDESAESLEDTKKETAQKPADGSAAQDLADFTREKFQASQQIREAARAVQQTPVQKENLFEAMVERIDMMKTADMRQMTIQLNPDFLGDVTLNITMDAAGLHVKIGAGNREVSGMINAQINTLIETLTNKGIEVAKIEVAYSGVEHNNANNTPQEQQQQGQPGRSRRGLGGRRIESTAFYAVSALEEMSGYLDMGVSSVEYRA